MFTGLIEEVGHIVSVSRRGTNADFIIQAQTVLDDLAIGDSVMVNGACLTVVAKRSAELTVQAVEETLRRTTLGALKHGAPVNLERALRLGARLGGHIVQGHVDGTGRIVSLQGTGDNVVIAIATTPDVVRYIVEKGSVAIDGISLTVTFVRNTEFGVSIIPHTLNATSLGNARTGDMVNIETDILAKYVEKLLPGKESLSIEQLKKLGF